MKPQPTGRLVPTANGADLVIERTFRAPIEDVWESVTVSASTARWFGAWEGEAGVGKTIRVKMVFEQGDAWTNVLITACEPPRRLSLTTNDDHGSWQLELALAASGDTTKLVFTQHMIDPTLAKDAGPGWEYYLDNLVAARAGQPLPKFDDYYPAQQQYYVDQMPPA
jgi:uncharacterized protein YndB with AHSA1/START domain